MKAVKHYQMVEVETWVAESLTKRELQVLELLAGGASYDSIRHHLNVSPANLHLICYHIRTKAGIADTKNVEQCKKALASYKPRAVHPTPLQVKVMRLYAEGMKYKDIAVALDSHINTMMNACSLGCKRLGIREKGIASRRALIREALGMDGVKPDPMADEMF